MILLKNKNLHWLLSGLPHYALPRKCYLRFVARLIIIFTSVVCSRKNIFLYWQNIYDTPSSTLRSNGLPTFRVIRNESPFSKYSFQPIPLQSLPPLLAPGVGSTTTSLPLTCYNVLYILIFLPSGYLFETRWSVEDLLHQFLNFDHG